MAKIYKFKKQNDYVERVQVSQNFIETLESLLEIAQENELLEDEKMGALFSNLLAMIMAYSDTPLTDEAKELAEDAIFSYIRGEHSKPELLFILFEKIRPMQGERISFEK